MKKTALIFSLVFMLMLTCSVAFAGTQDFTLVNKTGYNIAYVYVSPTDVNDWQEDVMGSDVLMNGENVNIHFDRSESDAYWDIKVTFEDGSSLYWTKFNLRQISVITLKNNGKASYE